MIAQLKHRVMQKNQKRARLRRELKALDQEIEELTTLLAVYEQKRVESGPLRDEYRRRVEERYLANGS